jgi:phospholipid/cholesterol/gamma-HCH transport system substrate-binding protein
VRGSLRPILVKLFLFAAFTLAITGLLASVIGNVQPFTRFYSVKAEFADATGLLKADVVKIAGVNVGKVVGAEVRGRMAVVSLVVRKDVRLPRSVRAAIRYRNLVGQRMVVLSRVPGAADRPLLATNGSARIAISQTSPAFDLGIVFNNLKPVLENLNPDDANLVSHAVVRIFAGREERLQKMIADLADLAQALGSRGPVVSNLIRDLNVVVTNLAQRDGELRSLLSSFDEVLTTLGSRSDELARAVENLGDASNGLADLLQNNRPPLDDAIKQLSEILVRVAAHKQDLDAALRQLPDTTHALNRATTYAEVANLNVVCFNGMGCPAKPAGTTATLHDILSAPLGARR